MKSIINILLGLLITTSVLAQRPEADVLATSKGNLTIQPVNHATLALTWNNITIYTDPNGGTKPFTGLAAPDVIVVTDIHGDHFNPQTLEAIVSQKTVLIVPKAVAEKLGASLKDKAVVLDNGKSTQQSGITIEAIPMYNLPESPDSKHTKGRGNGYVITFGNKRVYISGDTNGIPEMRNLKNIDVAFVCMNPPYTMDVAEAASAVLDFKPAIVYPYHYRKPDGFSDVKEFKKLVEEKDKKIEVRLRNWYAE